MHCVAGPVEVIKALLEARTEDRDNSVCSLFSLSLYFFLFFSFSVTRLSNTFHSLTTQGNTALIISAMYNEIPAMKELLAHGADINARNRNVREHHRYRAPLFLLTILWLRLLHFFKKTRLAGHDCASLCCFLQSQGSCDRPGRARRWPRCEKPGSFYFCFYFIFWLLKQLIFIIIAQNHHHHLCFVHRCFCFFCFFLAGKFDARWHCEKSKLDGWVWWSCRRR